MNNFKEDMQLLTIYYGLALAIFDFKLAAILKNAMLSYAEKYIKLDQ